MIKATLEEIVSLKYVKESKRISEAAHSIAGPLWKKLGVATALGAQPYSVMVNGCLFDESQVIKSPLTTTTVAPTAFKKIKSRVNQIDSWVPYKTTSNNHFLGGEIGTKMN